VAQARRDVGPAALGGHHDQTGHICLGVAQPAADVEGCVVQRIQLVDEQAARLLGIDLHCRQRLAQRLAHSVQLLRELTRCARCRMRDEAREERRGELATVGVESRQSLPGHGPDVDQHLAQLVGLHQHRDAAEPEQQRLARQLAGHGGEESGAAGRTAVHLADQVVLGEAQDLRVDAWRTRPLAWLQRGRLLAVPAQYDHAVADPADVPHLADDDPFGWGCDELLEPRWCLLGQGFS
jgi:hypothetical protein